jgi:hypothetical protein
MIRLRNVIPFLVLSSCVLQNCDSPTGPSNLGANGLKAIPVIKGIYVTTVDINSAKGYKIGKTLGEPSYILDSSSVIACPNPYSIFDNPWGFRNMIAVFNLPPKCIIQIYRGISYLEARWKKESQKEKDTQIMGAIINDHCDQSIRPIRTIEHESGSGDEIWDLLDANGKLVPSGFYRIYIIPILQGWGSIRWADVYLITDSNWKDPTGWLGNAN